MGITPSLQAAPIHSRGVSLEECEQHANGKCGSVATIIIQLKGTFVNLLDMLWAPFARPTFSQQLASRRERWEKGARPNFGPIYGKLGGRKFMEENGCKVPDLLGLYNSIEEIPQFSDLPSSFVLKPSRGDGAKNVFVMSNGSNLLDGKQYTREAMIQAIKNSKEGSHYEGKYLVEELLVN